MEDNEEANLLDVLKARRNQLQHKKEEILNIRREMREFLQ